ncbi:MAG: YibE/F family protein [Scrofimicrobium sp.]
MSHSHSHGHGGKAPASHWVVVGLAITLALMFVATVVGAVMLWPSASDLPEKRPVTHPGTETVNAVILSYEAGDPDDVSIAATATVEIDGTGEVAEVQLNPSIARPEIVGHRVTLMSQTQEAIDLGQPAYIFMDFHRTNTLLILGAIFAICVVAVAGLKGMAALIGLVAGLAVVWFFTLPALLAGRPALAVALVTASLILFVVVYMAHGISVKSTTALLGTFAGVAAVIVLASWAIPSAILTPEFDEEMGILAATTPGIDLRGVLLCGMVLSGVGVLNDVTITQASAVWELRGAAPGDSRMSIFTRAMRIGRDHIASTVYTIAFAYVGGALALLLLVDSMDYGALEWVSFSDVASELVSIGVASIGLVLTIPLTTAIAAALVGGPENRSQAKHTRSTGGGDSGEHVLPA